LQFEFRVCPAFRSKPQPKEQISGEHQKMIGPGSDLQDEPPIEITRINGSHIVLFNKFCISRSQLMIVTADSNRRQHDPLDGDDLEVARILLMSMKSPHYIFFNCGMVAGSSRKHKHLQVVRMPHHDKHLFVNLESTEQFPKMPYKYFGCDFRNHDPSDFPTKEKLLDLYRGLLGQCKQLLPVKEDESVPHDFILTAKWMLLIPRSKRNFEGSSDVNAPGMLGMVWLKHDEEVTKWKELGPARVLRHLGVPEE
jgi:ATP adenylyltransferase/5',5'''-P-1,P-4-tetraphosphate phosphorylase II